MSARSTVPGDWRGDCVRRGTTNVIFIRSTNGDFCVSNGIPFGLLGVLSRLSSNPMNSSSRLTFACRLIKPIRSTYCVAYRFQSATLSRRRKRGKLSRCRSESLIARKESPRRSKLIPSHAFHYFLSLSHPLQRILEDIAWCLLRWIWIGIPVMCCRLREVPFTSCTEDGNDWLYGLICGDGIFMKSMAGAILKWNYSIRRFPIKGFSGMMMKSDLSGEAAGGGDWQWRGV